MLVGDVETRLRELLMEKASEIGVTLEAVNILPEHIHVFCKTPPSAAPHWVVQQFKGFTSRVLRGEFPHLRSKLPTLWTRSYYCESVGHISERTVLRYIQEQKKK